MWITQKELNKIIKFAQELLDENEYKEYILVIPDNENFYYKQISKLPKNIIDQIYCKEQDDWLLRLIPPHCDICNIEIDNIDYNPKKENEKYRCDKCKKEYSDDWDDDSFF